VLRQRGESNIRRQGSEFDRDPSAGRDYERQLIIGMLRKYRKVNHAARAMGIARSTLYRKFAELEIDPSQITAGPNE
jgi:sigma-54 dependent transcriptional regulator, acetoin dehydrogenase operon transcriptional activator AcoR